MYASTLPIPGRDVRKNIDQIHGFKKRNRRTNPFVNKHLTFSRYEEHTRL